MIKRIAGKIRLSILTIFIVFISYEAYMHQVIGGGPEGSPSIHALCPYGGLESLYAMFLTGTLIDKIYGGTIVLFVVSVMTAIFFKRGFCGWICPFGGIQELLARLGQKSMGKKLTMPPLLDKYLRYLKYLILLLTAVLSWKTASMWVSPYDPWAAFGHLGEGFSALWKEFPIGFTLLLISFTGSFLYDRFFCKYLCPMGGFLGIVSKISPFKIKRNKEVCINCNLCTKVCPMNIEVAKVETASTMECINCQECVEVCPKKGALTNSVSFHKKLVIPPLLVGMSILIIYFGGIGTAKMLNLYKLLPGQITGETIVTDVDTLKGYMTLAEISSLMKIPLDEVYTRMVIPKEVPPETAVKELDGFIPGFDFHEARNRLAD